MGNLPPHIVNFPAGPSVETRSISPEVMNATYTETVISSGTAVILAKRGGAYELASASGTDDSGAQSQHPFAWASFSAGKYHRFLWSGVTISETTSVGVMQIDKGLGLATVDSTVQGSAPTNQVGLESLDGATVWTLKVRVAAAETVSVALASTIVLDTAYDIAIEVYCSASGVGNIAVYINGSYVGGADNASIPTALLADYAYCYAGEASGGIKSLNFKNFSAVLEK
jgi:hypothetical protein